jgi:glycosyltransferase involved in cell wall biosynthesis
MRSILIHYHIFKNAGSTIDAILRRNFPSACGAIESDRVSARLAPDQLLHYALDNPHLSAISSHTARLPLPSHPHLKVHSILFLRHPIDRIGSVYAFDRRQPEVKTEAIRLAHEADLRGYIHWILHSPASVTISNWQTMWLAASVSDLHDTTANQADLRLALDRLQDLGYFGLVESFDESLMLLQDYLRNAFGALDLSYAVQNRSQDRKASLQARLDEIEAQLGPALYQELLEKNALDLELYRSAVDWFEARVSPTLTRHDPELRAPASVSERSTSHPGLQAGYAADRAPNSAVRGPVRRVLVALFPRASLHGRIARLLNRGRLQIAYQLRVIWLRSPRIAAYYREHGFTATITAAGQMLWPELAERSSIRQLMRVHPRTFAVSDRQALSTAQRKEALEAAASAALRRLFDKLDFPQDVGLVLPPLRKSFGRLRFYRALDDLLAFDECTAADSDQRSLPVLQAAELDPAPDARRRRRILFITGIFPSALHGGGNRVSSFLKILSEENDIYLCTAFHGPDDEESLRELAPYCRSVLKLSPWEFGGKQSAIKAWLQAQSMDVIHYEWPPSLDNYDPDYGRMHVFTYMEAVSLRLVMDMHNAEPLSAPWLEKLLELIHLLRLELVTAAGLHARVAVTTKDAEFFRHLYPSQEYTVLNHGISMDDFVLPDIEPEPNTLVYVGNYRHYPNQDAMALFFEKIWPDVLKSLPDAHIYVVGANPPESILNLADPRHVTITGAVADIRPWIQRASIGIAPLITGAGLRGKVMEYAALRRTFVATAVAMSDLAFRDGVDYLRAEEPRDFAAKIIRLLGDADLRRDMSSRAYDVVRQKYDNRKLVGYLGRLYRRLEKGSGL